MPTRRSPTCPPSPALHVALPIALLCLLCLPALPACQPDGAEDSTARASSPIEASFAPHACRMPIPDGLDDDELRCGTVTVAADATGDDPEGATLQLEVAVLGATGDDPRPDPIVFIGGGPGASSLDSQLQTHAVDVLSPLRRARDIVFFDQRGVGRSTPSLACPEVAGASAASLARDDSPAEERETLLDAYGACFDRLRDDGVDLSRYHGAAIAADVAALMRALGHGRYNLYGVSYGGRFAQAVLGDAPEGVRSAILDAAVAPEDPIVGLSMTALAQALQRVSEDCIATGSCDDGLLDALYDLAAQLDAAPYRSEVEGDDGQTVTMVWNGARFVRLLRGLLSAERVARLPAIVELLTAGAHAPVLDPATLAFESDPSLFSDGFYAAVLCADELPFDSEADLARASAELRAELVEASQSRDGRFLLELCERFAVPARPEREADPIDSPIPTLILHGSYDASVPPSASEAAHRNLERSQYILFPAIGHGVLRSLPGDAESPSCAQRLVAEFLDDPDGELDASCAGR